MGREPHRRASRTRRRGTAATTGSRRSTPTSGRTSSFVGDLLAALLPAAHLVVPESTYLAWVDCRELGLGDDPAAVFLERGRVALNSGPTFGLGGDGHVRINLAASRATLTEAVERMAASVG